MKIQKTLPPAAAPIQLQDIAAGALGFLNGEKTIRNFEDNLKDYFGTRFCFAVSSGKAAFTLILETLHHLLPQKKDVLIPAYTCYSVPSAIVRAGLRVCLCDVDPTSLDFEENCLKEQIRNTDLLCVVPTHLFGLPADVAQVRNLIGERSVFVVEDAAQAMGAEWNGRRLGTQGDVGFFSLGRGKAFSSAGGGLILTNDDRIGHHLESRLKTLSSFGMLLTARTILESLVLSIFTHPSLFWLPKSLPFLGLGQTVFDPCFPVRRLSTFQAGIARRWQDKIRCFRQARRRNAMFLVETGIWPTGTYSLPLPDLIRFPLLIHNPARRQALLRQGDEQGLGFSPGYPDTIAAIPGLHQNFPPETFQGAKDIATRLITVPIHPFMDDDDLRKILETLSPSPALPSE